MDANLLAAENTIPIVAAPTAKQFATITVALCSGNTSRKCPGDTNKTTYLAGINEQG
jgi:hypothetical protein